MINIWKPKIKVLEGLNFEYGELTLDYKYMSLDYKYIKFIEVERGLRIAIGSDHGGFHLKKAIKEYLDKENIVYEDFGTYNSESVDYPDYAEKVAIAVASGEYDKGILCCGTGIGVSIVANKIPGIRAALCNDTFSARAAREHNDANILTLGERVIGPGLAIDIVSTWLKAEFSGGRHARRVEKITAIEKRQLNK
ncbi:MAG: ribose 5-phosphate isomerase [Clostridia bacterium]|nr:ribose 5-phosphate isomerase [Clostridia bacterium]